MDDVISAAQRLIIRHPARGGHMLVLAAPGSGKTRVITERVRYMLGERAVPPEQMVVMTFTEKAAEQLSTRLEDQLGHEVQGIRIGTIHNICNLLLERHGSAIGLPPSYKIFDARRQEEALRRAAVSAGRSLERPADLNRIKDAISRAKRRGIRLDQEIHPQSGIDSETRAIGAAYCQALKEGGALDFDDLIMYAIALFEDAEVASSIVADICYVFVDEYHDLSPEQLDLLCRIAPPSAPDHQVMVVADPNQAIYAWRGADAERMIGEYRRRYRPATYELEENYRSAGNLVRAAGHLISPIASSHAAAVHEDGLPIDVVACPDADAEAEWLARQIRNARASGRYRYDDIAILYRVNARVDIAEATLLREGVPLQRTQENRFFDDPDVQAMVRYLSLTQALADETFEPSLHWPRVIVDEVTMAHLHRLAAAEGLTLTTLARTIDSYADHVSPLTRTLVKDFVTIFDVELSAVASEPIATIVHRLLSVLRSRRSPIAQSSRENLQGILESLRRPLHSAVRYLGQAIADGRPIALVHDGAVDSAAGAVILAHVLNHYLQHDARIVGQGELRAERAFVITLGASEIAGPDGFGLAVYQTALRTLTYSISTQAWRIGQMLLMERETLRDGRFILYDLETTGTQIRSTEILEMAALEVAEGRPTHRHFHTLVRPAGRISPAASQVHGITEEVVRDRPTVDLLLPQYLAFLGDATLVGHNIEQFDHPVLSRVARSLGLEPPRGQLIDTCKLARRLLPDNSHRLEMLAHHFGFDVVQNHRALDDVQLNARVFDKLLDVLDREREIDILPEALPLVALGIGASGVPLADYNELLVQAGARAMDMATGAQLCLQLRDQASDIWYLDDCERWLAGLQCADPEDDRRWDELARRWADALGLFGRTFADQSLTSFLRYVGLATSIDYREDDHERVALMTIHAAKGKEWPLVFILGVEEGSIPAYFAQEAEALAEERRILYVGMTRAKQRLCLSHVASLKGYRKSRSRFLGDIPRELITERAVQGAAGGDRGGAALRPR